MKAEINVTIKFKIIQEIDDPCKIIDGHDVAQTAANEVCDILTDFNAVTSYEIVENTLSARGVNA